MLAWTWKQEIQLPELVNEVASEVSSIGQNKTRLPVEYSSLHGGLVSMLNHLLALQQQSYHIWRCCITLKSGTYHMMATGAMMTAVLAETFSRHC
jgi:hypothetical protein